MSGKITRLSIEQGETVVIGTMNNPGSLLLTISDLTLVEVVVQVDETEVPNLSLGDSATVDIDAFPNEKFSGRITEIGNSAIRPPSSTAAAGQQAAIDFEVVITLDPTTVPLRPDLSATAEIVTDVRNGAVAVPILALTVRDTAALSPDEVDDAPDEPAVVSANAEADKEPVELEGVFVVHEGKVIFKPVVLGIAGQDYFEALSGLAVGDTVVAGPYQAVRNLANGDLVRPGAAAQPAPES